LEPLAAEVAQTGALVYLPTWPVIDQVRPFPEDEGDEPYRRQSEAVICVLRDVKRTAAELGGDPGDVTLVGSSGGAMVGARVAIVAEPPWPGIDCDAGIDHRPERFIGLAGDYEGLYQYATPGWELYRPHDVLTIEPTNPDLDVWLLHGQNDESVGVRMSARFVDHLAQAGIDARLLTTDSDHVAQLDMSSPAGEFTAARIVAIIHGRAEPQWWPDIARCDLDARGRRQVRLHGTRDVARRPGHDHPAGEPDRHGRDVRAGECSLGHRDHPGGGTRKPGQPRLPRPRLVGLAGSPSGPCP
jgi:predicted esterase